GNLTMLGFNDASSIWLSEIMSKLDLNNIFAEVSGKKEYIVLINSLMYSFSHAPGFSIPLKIENKTRWLNFITTPIINHQDIVTFVVSDITEIMTEEEKNYRKMHQDSLTGLYNKYTFDYHYGLRYKNKNLHLIYLDLDDFKIVNDTFGHIVGNMFLKEFSKILESLQSDDNLFYRIGGDEFIGLFYQTTEEIEKLAAFILEKTQKIKIPMTKHQISVSIGIIKSVFGKDLARKADEVLYEVKKSGKNNLKVVIETS
ncbi:MAG: GGDEF domain-containing protein, partial [Acholeplasmataceae bacterium]|nr:GGDEF domain-containing protein [Acholeplasmataceae bacterium]